MLVRPRLIAALLVAALVAAACGGDGDVEVSGSTTGDGLVARALTEVPASLFGGDVRVELYVGDLTAATEAAGLSRPGSADDVEGLRDWLGPLAGVGDAPVFVPVPELHRFETTGMQSATDELGWSIVDVETFVEAGGPLNRFTVVRGEGIAPVAGLVEGIGGVLSLGEGEDLDTDPERRSAARPLGRPLRLRADGDAVAVSLTTDAALVWRTDDERLADSPRFVRIADALDEVGVVSAAVLEGAATPVASLGVAAADPDELLELLGTPALTAPFLATGLGWYVDDGDAMVRIAYSFSDAATAEAQLPVIEELFTNASSVVTGQPMSDLLLLRSAATTERLAVVDVAMPDGRPPSVVLLMLLQGETIFLVS